MILTEKEAVTKWCPFSKPDFVSDCKASGCMAWRLHWEDQAIHGMTLSTRTEAGYCGLAGEPESAV